MKQLIAFLTGFSILVLLWGCPSPNKQDYYDAWFPTTPQNLVDVNTAYDDYNSMLPETHFGKQLIFSSNRYGFENDFDIVGDNFHAIWYMETGEFRVTNEWFGWQENFIPDILKKANTEQNEFAPYFISYDIKDAGKTKRMFVLLYSTGSTESSYHESFIYGSEKPDGSLDTVYSPSVVANLNDENQQYVSFYGPEVESLDLWELNPDNFTQMYFDESTGGNSNIYKIDIPADSPDFLGFLKDTVELQKNKITDLNSNANDRCPFINGNMMVFTSDRPGGYGGFDLYYSFYNGLQWSEPVNFGEEVNSAYDEFRPVAVQVYEFKNDLMIFSSNRPGGQGGYDLYYVGIDKITPTVIAD